MFCKMCGAEVSQGQPICHVCGNPINNIKQNNYNINNNRGVNNTYTGYGMGYNNGYGNNYEKDTSEYTAILNETTVISHNDDMMQPYIQTPVQIPQSVKNTKINTKKKNPPNNKAKIIIFSVIGGIAAAALICIIVYMASPARKISVAINEEKYDTARDVYEDKVKDSGFQQWLLTGMIKDELSDIEEGYSEGDMDFDEVEDKLQTISGFEMEKIASNLNSTYKSVATMVLDEYKSKEIDYEDTYNRYEALIDICQDEVTDTEIISMRDTAIDLKISREAYEKAEKKADQGNYADAIKQYRLVGKSDENYTDAQEKIEEYTEIYKDDIFAQIGSPQSNEEYEGAIALLEAGIEVLPEDEELAEEKKELESQYGLKIKNDAIEQSTQLMGSGDYAGAFTILDSALKYNKDDEELISFTQTSKTNYVNSITEQVNGCVAAYDYSTAISVCEAAVGVLPDDEALKSLYEQTKNSLPATFVDLKGTESQGCVLIEAGSTTDALGNTYQTGNLYEVSVGEDKNPGYIKFNLNGEYERLIGTVAPGAGCELTGCILTVYGDDQALYTSNPITPYTEPFAIDVNVTGVSNVYVEFARPATLAEHGIDTDYWKWMKVVMADMTFFKN